MSGLPGLKAVVTVDEEFESWQDEYDKVPWVVNDGITRKMTPEAENELKERLAELRRRELPSSEELNKRLLKLIVTSEPDMTDIEVTIGEGPDQ